MNKSFEFKISKDNQDLPFLLLDAIQQQWSYFNLNGNVNTALKDFINVGVTKLKVTTGMLENDAPEIYKVRLKTPFCDTLRQIYYRPECTVYYRPEWREGVAPIFTHDVSFCKEWLTALFTVIPMDIYIDFEIV